MDFIKLKQILQQNITSQNYINFNKKLISTKRRFLGVKIPKIREIVKQVKGDEIMALLPVKQDDSFEEVLFKGFLLGKIKNLNELEAQILNFLPHIDNWCTCDTVVSSLKQLKKPNDLFEFFVSLTQSTKEFYSRFAFVVLKCYYLNPEYINKICQAITLNNSQDYYVQMAIAWLCAEMCVNFKSEVLWLLKSGKLSKFVVNKTIQKARESFRVENQFKQELLKYKIS